MTASMLHAPASPLPVDVQAQAQADANRYFGDTPVAPWQARDAAHWTRWAGGAAALVVVAVVAVVVAAGTWLLLDDAHADAAPSLAKHATIELPPSRVAAPLGHPDDDIVDEDPPLKVSAPQVAVPVAHGGEPLAVTRQGHEWRIEASGAARLLVAQRLAEASGSSLRGDLGLLAAARPLDLRWRGRSTAEAWQAVLGPGLSFVTQCSASRCRVWLLQEAAPDGGLPTTARPVIPLPSIEPVVVAAAAAPLRQSDSPDPRIAAHHD